MSFQSDFYIGGEFGPRKTVLDNLRDWFKSTNAKKIKALRGAYYIGKTVSSEFSCKDCNFKMIEINWNDELPAAEKIDSLAEDISEFFKQLPMPTKESTKINIQITDPYDDIKDMIKNIKETSNLSVKYTQLASLIEYYNRISGETIVLLVNSCRSEIYKEEFKRLLLVNIDNKIKVIFEKYKKDDDLDLTLSGFRYGKIRKNPIDTVFLEPPNYNNIKLCIEEFLGNVNTDCIIEYVGCHPAFLLSLCGVISKDEMIDLDKLVEKVKEKKLNPSYDKHLKIYFNILKKYESDLYKEYINHFMDVTKVESGIIEDMIKWGLCYKDSKEVIKTPILFKNYILKEIKDGNIESKDVAIKINVDKIFKVLDDLDRLVLNPSTLESEIHKIFEDHLWLFVPGFKKLTSNKTLNTALNKVDNKRSKKRRKDNSLRKRPDLILKQDEMNNELVLIEFKRPSHCLKIGDEIQIRNYRNDLNRELSVKRIKMILLGGTKDPGVLNDQGDQIKYLTYYDVISKARDQISSLIDFMRT